MKYIIDFSILKRNRNFSLLFFGQFISFLGTMITSVALPYQIYTQTHSTLMVGLLSLVQLIPLLFTALIGGVFADRYHRRQLLLISEFILALCALGLAFNAYQSTPSLTLIFILAFIMSAFTGLHRPALDSIVQQIVDKNDFVTAAALGSFKGNFCMIAGPAIGGFIIAYFGVANTFTVDFFTFTLSLVAISLISNVPKPSGTFDESTWAALKSGCRYAFSRQELVGSYVVDFNAMIFGMPNALFPAIAQSFGGAKALGLLYAAPAVGALLVSLLAGFATRIHHHGRAIAISAALWGIAIVGFGLSSNFLLALFFLALAGAFDGISGIFRSTMWNETIPQHYRGRLAGIEMISYLSGPRLGDTEAGLVAAAFGVPVSIVSGGVLCILGVGLSCYLLPKFWNYKKA